MSIMDEQELRRMKWLDRMLRSQYKVKQMFRADPCSFCNGPGGTLDHIHPRHIQNGHDRGDMMNYTGACPDCNFDKGSGDFLRYFAMKQGKPMIGYVHSPKA